MSAIQGRVWHDGTLTQTSVDLDRVGALLDDPECLIWVDLCGPHHDDLTRLAEDLHLDLRAVEDAVADEGRPKVRRHVTHMSVTAYATDVSEGAPVPSDAVRLHKVSAFVLPRAIVTVRPDDGFDIAEVVERWDENADLLALPTQAAVGALVHGLLDVVVDSHFAATQRLDDAFEDVEDGLFDEQTRTRVVQHQIYALRKQLVQLRRVVLPMREVVNAILRHRRSRWHSGEEDTFTELDSFYDDLYDQVLRASEWTESLRDLVGTVFETNLSLQDAQLNTVMRRLAGWAAIIAVPTAVTGWFGQNLPYPGYQSHGGLALSVGVTVVFVVVLYLLFKRRGWI